jgi:hypothetical protein
MTAEKPIPTPDITPPEPPNPELDRLIEIAIQQAERVLVDKPNAQILPTFVLEKPDNEIGVFATPWTNEREKEITVYALRHVMRETKVLRYSFISEAWMATARPGTEHLARLPDGEMPSQRPDRVEVVIITASDATTIKSAMLRIVRGEGGTVVRLDRDLADAKAIKGRFADLLKPDSEQS